MWQYLVNVHIITPSDFKLTPDYSTSSRRVQPTARRRSVWTECCGIKDSRHSPRTSEVGSPSSPAKIPWEKLGWLFFVILF